jgi:hypothetical protein
MLSVQKDRSDNGIINIDIWLLESSGFRIVRLALRLTSGLTFNLTAGRGGGLHVKGQETSKFITHDVT